MKGYIKRASVSAGVFPDFFSSVSANKKRPPPHHITHCHVAAHGDEGVGGDGDGEDDNNWECW